MNRSKKWLMIIGIILLLPLPCYSLISTKMFQQQTNFSLAKNGDFQMIAEWYVVVVSVIIIAYLLIYFLALLFWPTRRKFNLIAKKDGRVVVTNKAINGFISSSLEQEPYLSRPKVTSKLTKRKIKIYVSGSLMAGENAGKIFADYLDKLAADLRNLLGIDQKPKIEIKFSNYEKSNPNKSRVK